jgi:uncharacterized membrane protein YdjX (TVP38/TMEM64 family)
MRSRKLIWAAVALLLAGAVVLLAPGDLIEFETHPAWAKQLDAALLEWGVLAPLAFVGVYVAQVFLPATPGPFLALVGGYLFGPYLGGLYALVGVALGVTLGAGAMRVVGRRWLVHLLPAVWLARWDQAAAINSAMGWGIAFLVPAGDWMYLAAGLTRVPILKLALAAILGRLPVVAASAFAGHAANGAWHADAAVAALLCLIALALILGVLAARAAARRERTNGTSPSS